MYSRVAPPNQYLEGLATGNTECNSKTKCVEDAKGMKDRHGSQEKPSNVSNETWKKFQQLKERRREMCQPLSEKKKHKRTKNETQKEPDLSSPTQKKMKSKILNENEHSWKELRQNMDTNAHLTQDSIAIEKPKTKLEEKLDEAIKEGNFTEAEAISDKMAQQELGVKIVDAIEMRDYKKRKEVEEECQRAKKKKKLIWGFEQKERWESKGNM